MKDVIIDNILEYIYTVEYQEDRINHTLRYGQGSDWPEDLKSTVALEAIEFTEDSSLVFSLRPEGLTKSAATKMTLHEAEQMDILLRLILRNEGMPRTIEIGTREIL